MLQSDVRIVGSVLVRDEDVFVERAIRNAAAFCDRIHVVDHLSHDRTWAIVESLAQELGHVDARRARHSGESHRVLEPYVGTRTWVLGIDGDELFDPVGLARLREELLAGAHRDVFRLKAHVLNCDRLDRDRQSASGHMAPPARPVTKLFNLAAVSVWTGCPERLHAGRPLFRSGYDWGSRRDLHEGTTWDTDPLRLLHVCFLKRSSRDDEDGSAGRLNLDESRAFRRGALGAVARALRRPRPSGQIEEIGRRGGNWKQEMYMRGPRVTVDATPFLGRGH